MSKKTIVFIAFIMSIGITFSLTHAMYEGSQNSSALVRISSLKILLINQLIKCHFPSLFGQEKKPYNYYSYCDKRPDCPDLSIIRQELKQLKKWETESRKRGATEDTILLIRDACSYLYAEKYFNMSADALNDPYFSTDTILKLITLSASGTVWLHYAYVEELGMRRWRSFPMIHIYGPEKKAAKKITHRSMNNWPAVYVDDPADIQKKLVSRTEIEINVGRYFPENFKLSVPSALLLLKNLTEVNIRGVEKISPAIFTLPSLVDLAIQNSPNAFNDRIKDKLSLCTGLTTLALNSNGLSEIPLSIFSLTALTCLDVSNNYNPPISTYSFSNRIAELSPAISLLTNLVTLTIPEQKIVIPEEISFLTKLVGLSYITNRI